MQSQYYYLQSFFLVMICFFLGKTIEQTILSIKIPYRLHFFPLLVKNTFRNTIIVIITIVSFPANLTNLDNNFFENGVRYWQLLGIYKQHKKTKKITKKDNICLHFKYCLHNFQSHGRVFFFSFCVYNKKQQLNSIVKEDATELPS